MLNINHKCTGYRRASGFTLIELMVAMLIGLIIMGGVMQLFLTTRNTQRSSEDQIQMVADARFVMDTIAFDLRHAGIWGGTNETKLIACKKDSSDMPCADALSLATDDCEASWYYDLSTPVIASNNSNPYPTTCAKQGYKAGTDVIGIHYADTIPIPTGINAGELSAGAIYVRSNVLGGQLFEAESSAPGYPADSIVPRWTDDTRTMNYVLKTPLYYVSSYTDVVSDGIPSLHRVELTSKSTGPEMTDKVLLSGVEDMQFEFGIDKTNDFQVNTYVSADNVSAAEWAGGKVIAVKIWLLMRAQRIDKDRVGGDQKFKLADKVAQTYTDGARRFLMTSVVRLRNTARRDLSAAGAP